MNEQFISLQVDLPEALQSRIAEHLDAHPDKDVNQMFAGAIALYLMNSTNDPQTYQECGGIYLNAVYGDKKAA
jgi:hypothetical protein